MGDTLVTVRGGVVRSKHLRARISEMIADGLTETLVGEDFDFFADNVLGGNKSTSGR